jgi:sporulation protein YlmC with PRC-barrel domain
VTSSTQLPNQAGTQTIQPATQTTTAQNTGGFQAQPASQFIGQDCKTQQGESLGKIQDFVVDLESGRILYGVVNSGGSARGIPATLMQAAGNSITVQATKQQVNSAPVVPPGNTPQIGDISFATSVYQMFSQPMWFTATTQTGQSFGNPHRATELANFQVQDSANQNVGTIQNVLLDINAARVAFLVLNASTLLGQANQLIAVPPNAFTKGTGAFLVTGLDKNTLAAAPRTSGNWSELSDAAKASSIYSYFGKQPYFGTTGLTPTGRP